MFLDFFLVFCYNEVRISLFCHSLKQASYHTAFTCNLRAFCDSDTKIEAFLKLRQNRLSEGIPFDSSGRFDVLCDGLKKPYRKMLVFY